MSERERKRRAKAIASQCERDRDTLTLYFFFLFFFVVGGGAVVVAAAATSSSLRFGVSIYLLFFLRTRISIFQMFMHDAHTNILNSIVFLIFYTCFL